MRIASAILVAIIGLMAVMLAPQYAQVTRVIDGDTIEVRSLTGATARVRYIGIDTPEMDEAGGPEAKAANEKLVGGAWIKMQSDVSDKDVYGRLLRYVYTDGIMVNAQLIRLGHAKAVRYEPDTSNARTFENIERGR